MTDRYLEIATSDAVKQLQERWGSRSAYCRLETGPLTNNQLGPEEVAFIEAQDTFFLASVNEQGWPYMQQIESDWSAAAVDRGVIVQVEAFHWNCPKYIVPRFTETQVRSVVDSLIKRIQDLEATVARLSTKP